MFAGLLTSVVLHCELGLIFRRFSLRNDRPAGLNVLPAERTADAVEEEADAVLGAFDAGLDATLEERFGVEVERAGDGFLVERSSEQGLRPEWVGNFRTGNSLWIFVVMASSLG